MDDLKALRQRKHLTQKRLAAWVGVSAQTLRTWEYGTSSPRPHHIRQLADALGIDAEQLAAMLRESAEEQRRRARVAVRV